MNFSIDRHFDNKVLDLSKSNERSWLWSVVGPNDYSKGSFYDF